MMQQRTRTVLAWASVVALALAASLSGITNRFAFDDLHIIVEDNRTHSLAHWWQLFAQSYWPIEKGGDLYRPLTMLGFAIQWAIGNGAPLVFHIVSIALYALICAVFFAILLELLPLGAAWLGAALFAVHPVHVEAVANVVGQSELLAALFMLLALLVFLRARRSGGLPLRDTAVIVLLYLLGCLSKEHAIVLPALLLAAEATIFATQAPFRSRLATVRLLVVALAVAGVAFIWVRIHVLGPSAAGTDESNSLLVGQPFGIRVLTMLRVMLEWIRLFFWPAHLSADYSPRAIELVTGPSSEMFASVAIIVGFTGLAWKARHRVPVASFAFLWAAVALLIPSNLFLPTGFSVAERTLFLASGGVMLGVAETVAYLMENNPPLSGTARQLAIGAVGLILFLGVLRSGFRQPVWRDNQTLFTQTVSDVPASYKAHLAYAALLFQNNRRKEAFEEVKLAHVLYPKDLDVVEYAAQEYSRVEGCRRAVVLYNYVLAEDPGHSRSRVGLASCLIALHEHAAARKTIQDGLVIGESRQALEQLMAMNDSTEAAYRQRSGN